MGAMYFTLKTFFTSTSSMYECGDWCFDNDCCLGICVLSLLHYRSQISMGVEVKTSFQGKLINYVLSLPFTKEMIYL